MSTINSDKLVINLPTIPLSAKTFTYITALDGSSITTSIKGSDDNIDFPIVVGDTEIDFGIGVHVIIGGQNSGKSATVQILQNSFTNRDIPFVSVEVTEPTPNSFTDLADAFVDIESQINDLDNGSSIIFIDSLRSLMFNGGATLSGGISANLPLALTELTTFALQYRLCLFVTVNTLTPSMFEMARNLIAASTTSVLTPSISFADNSDLNVNIDVVSRYYARRSFRLSAILSTSFSNNDMENHVSDNAWGNVVIDNRKRCAPEGSTILTNNNCGV